MELQNKEHPDYADEINLYDYWMVIVKRKKLIIGLFLVSVIAAAIISLFVPKIYRGEAVFKIYKITYKDNIIIKDNMIVKEKEIVTAKEIIDILGDKKEMLFPNNHGLVKSLKISEVKGSTDKLRVTIESENAESIQDAMAEVAEYLNNFPLIKKFVGQERERMQRRLDFLSGLVKEYYTLADVYEKKIKSGNLFIFGFVPTDIKMKAFDLEDEKRTLERDIKDISGIELLEKPYISKTPVRPNVKMNIAFAGIVSLTVGIILAFFMKYIEKGRKV